MNKRNKLVALLCATSILISGCSANSEDTTEVSSELQTEQGTVLNEASTETEQASETDSEETTETGFDSEINSVVDTETETEQDTEAYSEEYAEDEEDELTEVQRNSINMLNYMTVLTQEINASSGNQLFLESAYSSLVNDIYPNSVDSRTQAQISSLMDTIENYRMISVKRERLEYIYEQNRAQAMRQAIPNPVGLLSAVSSGSALKAAASVIYMSIDSASSYQTAATQADLQYIEDGWELDDAEAEELHQSTKTALAYMFEMVRANSLPGDYVLNQESVEDFVTWSEKSNLVSVISWLEENESTYKEFGPYWLELAEDYYQTEDYESCLSAISSYESVASRVFRKDIDYAEALPMAIISAKETMSEEEYVEIASNYCSVIKTNTKDSDWELRYFTAQIYMDLYAITQDISYLEEVYDIALNNVNVLVDDQRELNSTYLADIEEEVADEDATKREKAEVKAYNKSLKAERKIALPPVNEALYLNCDLLFALAEELEISETEQSKIDSILHENGDPIFLTEALDDRFWFYKSEDDSETEDVAIEFSGGSLTIPVTLVTERSEIYVEIVNEDGETIVSDWTIKEVKRSKNTDYTEYTAQYTSKEGKDYKYQDGDQITISITPVADAPDDTVTFEYTAKATKKLNVIDSISFERIEE